MASKPAKKPSSSSQPTVKVDEGTLVRYIGALKGVAHHCTYCGSLKRKAMMREYKGTLYCSRNCVRGVKRKEESNG
jgi:hypothetical protein